MALHLPQRLHAWWHRLIGPSDELEARQLYNEVKALLMEGGVYHALGQAGFVDHVFERLATHLGLDKNGDQGRAIHALILRLLEFEGWFVLPEVDWQHRYSISEYWAIRDACAVQKALVADLDVTEELLLTVLVRMLEPLVSLESNGDAEGISIPTTMLHTVSALPASVEQMIGTLQSEGLEDFPLLPRLQRNVARNLIRASGGNPDDLVGFNRAPKLPTQANVDDLHALVATYLEGTPLYDLLQQPVEFTIPTQTRYEHHHIVAGTGHGKTQTLQYLIAHDLEAVAKSERTVIVIDSQGDLIRNISKLAVFRPDGPLHDRITIIDPADVEYPVSLNMFDVGVERLQSYAPLERERLTNSILELYDFVLGSLLDAGMTQKQSVIFRYVTRLMLHIPGATIHTLRELMEEKAEVKYAEHIAKLSGSARHFFDTEFAGKEFKQTKSQVLRRLCGILENQTFERMFSHPKSKLDLFSEMNSGRVILINTAKDLLKEQGTQIFGRFFIALIAQAAQERATLPRDQRLSTMVYVDEAQDYFDQNIGVILAQARKQNVGMVLAHQFLGQLPPNLQDAFSSNTSIKFAGGVSAKDARSMAPMMYCDPSLIEAQPKGSFASYVKGASKGALPLQFPFGHMEAMRKMSGEQQSALRDRMRERYAVHHSEIGEVTAPNTEVQRGDGDDVGNGEVPLDRSGNVNTEPGEEW